jgi:formate-dependent nitrite reductase membrane component NrfD
MLKAAPWGGEIASYFYFGGMSASAFVLARLAERFGAGSDSYRAVTRAGTKIAALAAVPCAPLLIKDIGDPTRFHHMLRVFKPQSPMNVGAWTLVGYSGVAAAALLREWRKGSSSEPPGGVVLAILDGIGIPLALLLAGYTGVLLSGTSTPVWSRSHWLGPLFSAGAMSTGASAISLMLTAQDPTFANSSAGRALEKVKLAAHAAETVAMAGFVSEMGDFATPLTKGKMSVPFLGAAAATIGAGVLSALPLKGRAGTVANLACSMLSLVGGFAARWALLHAGATSAKSADAPRAASSNKA